ncbi:hypothetical protein FJ417_04760 [Mesorhizobium sp. B3-1-7]|nr:hypothetical protein FJ417_04760 [Mesorhizobium sp. B3-1-7]
MVMLESRLWAWRSEHLLSRAAPDRHPPRRASLDTSPPIDGGEERREAIPTGSFPLPAEGGEVALPSSDGVGEPLGKKIPPSPQ